jgi:hypothetical protein
MTETVTSKFRKSIWVGPIFLCILVFMLISVIVILAERDYSISSAHQIMAILAFLIVVIGFFTYGAARSFIKVMVEPNKLLLYNVLTTNKRTIYYTEIVHVTRINLGYNDRYSLVEDIMLKIELDTGEKLYLPEERYKNFDELAEAIRRARFKLD